MERTGFQCRISAIVVTASPSKLATKKAQIRLNLRLWRRERDSNPCPAINRLPHFECGPFDLLGTSPYTYQVILQFVLQYYLDPE